MSSFYSWKCSECVDLYQSPQLSQSAELVNKTADDDTAFLVEYKLHIASRWEMMSSDGVNFQAGTLRTAFHAFKTVWLTNTLTQCNHEHLLQKANSTLPLSSFQEPTQTSSHNKTPCTATLLFGSTVFREEKIFGISVRPSRGNIILTDPMPSYYVSQCIYNRNSGFTDDVHPLCPENISWHILVMDRGEVTEVWGDHDE